MNHRRTHTKSRSGCAQCKKRHLKCDEEHPRCTNCKDYQDSCTYLPKPDRRHRVGIGETLQSSKIPPDSSERPHKEPASSPSTSESLTVSSTPGIESTDPSMGECPPLEAHHTSIDSIHQPKAYSITDMQLLHHYSTVVYSTMSTIDEQREAWRTTVVKMALQHPFFLQGILALSALHMSHTTPSQAQLYLFVAATHQDAALSEFRRLLGEQITSATFRSLFLFSCFLATYAFALPGVEGTSEHVNELRDSLEGFLNCVPLIRGATQLLMPWYDVLVKDELGVLLGPMLSRIDIVQASMAESQPLAQLFVACGVQPETERTNPYSSAIQDLYNAFGHIAEPKGSSTIAIVMTWPIAVPKEYLELLKEQDSKAMVILAHYAVLLHRQRSCWLFQNWGKQLIERIVSQLGERWEEALAWPKRMAQLDS